MEEKVNIRFIEVSMPSQQIKLVAYIDELQNGLVDIHIIYDHPTTGETREVHRAPRKYSFSSKHFDKEVEAYAVQEAMSDLMDNRHRHDSID